MSHVKLNYIVWNTLMSALTALSFVTDTAVGLHLHSEGRKVFRVSCRNMIIQNGEIMKLRSD